MSSFCQLVNLELMLGHFVPLLYLNFILHSINVKKCVKIVVLSLLPKTFRKVSGVNGLVPKVKKDLVFMHWLNKCILLDIQCMILFVL